MLGEEVFLFKFFIGSQLSRSIVFSIIMFISISS